jgi:hypothetical protein
LEEGYGLDVVLEEVSGLGQNSNSLVVVVNELFEGLVLLNSLGIELIEFLLETFNFSGLGTDESLHDGSSGEEITLEFGLVSDSLVVGVGEVTVEGRDVGIAGLLEGVVCSIILLLLGDVSVLKVVEGAEESI